MSDDPYASKPATPIGHSARVRTDVDYWSVDKIKDPPAGYVGTHRHEPTWKCVCAGQGGEVYSAQCPIHDPHVDTNDGVWRKWYEDHLIAQAKIVERLGW